MGVRLRGWRAGFVAAGIALLGLAPVPAVAHHVMGGTLPSTWLEGLLSGLGHPIIELDHFAFVVAVALMCAGAGRALALPLAFVLATGAGLLLHLQGIDLPGAELWVAASVLAAGALLVWHGALAGGVLAALLGLAGLLHGYAYAGSIIGAESASLLFYVIGFLIVQYGLVACMIVGLRALGGARQWHRPAGAAIAAAGLFFVVAAAVAV